MHKKPDENVVCGQVNTTHIYHRFSNYVIRALQVGRMLGSAKEAAHHSTAGLTFSRHAQGIPQPMPETNVTSAQAALSGIAADPTTIAADSAGIAHSLGNAAQHGYLLACPPTGWCFEHMTVSRTRCEARAASRPPTTIRDDAHAKSSNLSPPETCRLDSVKGCPRQNTRRGGGPRAPATWVILDVAPPPSASCPALHALLRQAPGSEVAKRGRSRRECA